MEYLLGTTLAGAVRRVLREPNTDVRVPALCDIEVLAGLRRARLNRLLSPGRAARAVERYGALPFTRHGHLRLLARIVELGHNVSPYDATYLALAERLDARLLTADRRLARAARARTSVDVIVV